MRAEELGFHAAYTYDHFSWGRLQNRPWFGAVPTLTAAACATSTIRLGTLVTNPNFRHPVPLAKDLLSIDDVSDGRLTVGIGSGGLGTDASLLGNLDWTPKERADRFEEFVGLLDELLREPLTTRSGQYYSAVEARMLPGTNQKPRPPFCIAAIGRRGFELCAQYGQSWVTIGRAPDDATTCFAAVTTQLQQLRRVLESANRPDDDVDKLLLDGLSNEKPLASLDAFVDWAGRYQALGITELVIHWPEPASLFDFDMTTFEQIATEGLAQLSTSPK